MSEVKGAHPLCGDFSLSARCGNSFAVALQEITNMHSLRLMLPGLLLLVLAGCLPPPPKFVAGNLNGVNHTSDAINYFIVSGHGGRNIPPFGYGGGACCMPLPLVWVPNIILKVQWETDPNPYADSPPLGTDAFRAFMVEHRKRYGHHTAFVELPPYRDGMCFEVHFMPCHQIKLSTSCWAYPSPNSPIKEPHKMQEPAVCPK